MKIYTVTCSIEAMVVAADEEAAEEWARENFHKIVGDADLWDLVEGAEGAQYEGDALPYESEAAEDWRDAHSLEAGAEWTVSDWAERLARAEAAEKAEREFRVRQGNLTI